MMKNKLMIISRNQEKNKLAIEKLALKDLIIFAPDNEQDIKDNISEMNIIFAEPPIAHQYTNLAKNLAWYQSMFA
jgi:hypothetical protein